MAKLIHGKQLRQNTLKENLLLVTGSAAVDGQLLAYDSVSGGFAWVDNQGGVAQIIDGTATSVASTGTTSQVNVVVDNQAIFVNSSNEITLGDPTTRLISGGDYTFADSIVINGDLTVLGTATTINTEELYVEDNLITLNSNFTAGTPTLNAGFEILRGDEPSVEMRWNESNNWWEVTNPDESAIEYNPILTTASLVSLTPFLTITEGIGSDADILNFDIDESQLSNIPNSALTNSDINISLGEGLTGDTSVELGGTLNVGIDSTYDSFVTGATYNEVSGNVDFTGRGDKFTPFTLELSGLVESVSANTFVNSGSISYVAEEGTLDLTRNDGQVVSISGVNNTHLTGATLDGVTDELVLSLNDGTDFTVDLSDVTGFWTAGTGTNAIAVKNFNATNTSGNKSINAADNSETSGNYSVAIGGSGHTAKALNSGIFAGVSSTINQYAYNSVISGGYYNQMNGEASFIGGGGNHNISGSYSAVIGGNSNSISSSASNSAMVGGYYNVLGGTNGAIIGGNTNILNGDYSAIIGGGNHNIAATSQNSVIIGGTGSSVAAGVNNVVVLGSNIGASVSNTVYVPFLNIKDAALATSNFDVLVKDKATGEVKVTELSGLTVDTYVTGGTISYVAEEGTMTFTNNYGDTFDVTGVNDTFTTGATIDSGSGLLTFTKNDGSTYDVSLSGTDLNDTYSTGVTTNNGQIIISGNDGFTTFSGGTVVETVTGNGAVTASTVNGDVVVGLDYSAIQLAVQTRDDKDLVPSASSGDTSDTGLSITNDPVNGAYVKVEINGVGYVVGDGVKTKDCYFSNDGGTTARAIADIVSGDNLIWNGVVAEFELDADDRVDFFYEILQ